MKNLSGDGLIKETPYLLGVKLPFCLFPLVVNAGDFFNKGLLRWSGRRPGYIEFFAH